MEQWMMNKNKNDNQQEQKQWMIMNDEGQEQE